MRVSAFLRSLLWAVGLAWLAAGPAAAQSPSPHPDAMAIQPDPHDFMTRSETSLLALGNPLRFAGINIGALALRPTAQGVQIPTDFETRDLLNTVASLGAGIVRSVSLGLSAGCPSCLLPAPGKFNAEALRRMDHMLRLARDRGLRLFIPLAGGGDACPAMPDRGARHGMHLRGMAPFAAGSVLYR